MYERINYSHEDKVAVCEEFVENTTDYSHPCMMVAVEEGCLLILLSQHKEYCVYKVKEFCEAVDVANSGQSNSLWGDTVIDWLALEIVELEVDVTGFDEDVCIEKDLQCIVHDYCALEVERFPVQHQFGSPFVHKEKVEDHNGKY